MPNAISSHFAITALQEGVTIQGSLRVSGALAQNYNTHTSACVPDWSADPTSRPTVYVVVRRGAAYVAAGAITQPQWTYNGVTIEWGGDGNSTNFLDSSGCSLFKSSSKSVSLGGGLVLVPCLTVQGNLASAQNTDLDTIGFSGGIEMSGGTITFQCQTDVKIVPMTTQGYLGLLTPESGIITTKGQDITMRALLYGDDGSAVLGYFPVWRNAGTEATIASDVKQITVNETDVVDNLVVRCDFYLDAAHTNRVCTAFASIDDTTDPEYLYVTLDGSNSDYSGQLSEGESCTVTAWVATMEDATAVNTSYSQFTCRFTDGAQNEITTADDSAMPSMLTNNHRGEVVIDYEFVKRHGYKISGIVTAQ